MAKRLTEDQINTQLNNLQNWRRKGDEIARTFEFRDFVHAMGFVNAVALSAEKVNHHPDIDIRWNTVTLVLSTHSAGGLTELDFTLARTIDTL